VRIAIPIPEVTVVLSDGAAAGDTLDRVMRAIAAATGGTVEPAGEGEKELRYDDVRFRYGLVEDKLVVTTAAQGITVIGEGGDALADDPEFEDAAEAAGMPEETASFVYVNLEDAVPALLGLVQVAGVGEQLDPRTRENLEPLKSFLAYAVPEGSLVRGKGFLRID
jgi:hypothetical protein